LARAPLSRAAATEAGGRIERVTDLARRPRILAALALAAGLAAGACQPTMPSAAPLPTTLPTGTATPGTPGPASTPGADASPAAGAGLGDALRDAIDVADILADLGRLQGFADDNGGARQAGSDAEAAATAFLADELRGAGLDVTLQPVDVPYFTQDAPSVLEIATDDGSAFEDLRDFKAMLFSASGEVTAQLYPLGFDPLAQPGASGGLGCGAGDWAEVPAGVIVLVQPAQCRRHDVVVHAQSAGAVAIITAYPGWSRDAVLRPTLINPDDIRIPALGVAHSVGVALAEAAAAGSAVHIRVATTVETRSSANVVAETPGGDPAHVLMLGGHLDSVIDGPGINDNGSGTMAILEIAREVAAAMAGPAAGTSPWKVRVAFWTGEELGLWGSSAYVQSLDGAAIDAIEAYLNFDMIGSPNGVRLVYDASGGPRPTEAATLTGLFGRAFERAGLLWQSAALGGSSDHFVFEQAGIAVGGLFSGANEPKTASQADLFGGTAEAPNDPCYHLACDTVDNVDPVLLEQMARAAAWVVGALASGEVNLGGA
jgi:Zn-dependent M28 family amino/carboxypeptidase